MQAITGCQTALTSKIDSLQLALGLIRKDIDKIHHRVTEAEHRIGDTQDSVRDHTATPTFSSGAVETSPVQG